MKWEEIEKRAKKQPLSGVPTDYFDTLEEKVMNKIHEGSLPGNRVRLQKILLQSAAVLVLLIGLFYFLPKSDLNPENLSMEEQYYFYMYQEDLDLEEVWPELDDLSVDTLESWILQAHISDDILIDELY